MLSFISLKKPTGRMMSELKFNTWHILHNFQTFPLDDVCSQVFRIIVLF